MNRIITLFSIAVIVFGCSPKLGSTIIARQTPLLDSDFVLVLDENDPYGNSGIEVGTIKSGDYGFSTNCDYQTVVQNLKTVCRQNGANVMKVTEHKVPDQWSSCDRITAKIYSVADYKVYQKQIEWTNKRRLTFQDFKAKPRADADASFGAETDCGFGFQIYASLLGGTTINVKNIFKCKSSWIRPEASNRAELLEHEQAHFDLSEIYARQLRKRLAESKTHVFSLAQEANGIFNEIQGQYSERQVLYDKETKHGLDKIAQARWKAAIANELDELKAYYEND